MYENPRREVISQLCNLTLIFTLMCRLLLSLNNMKYGQYKLSMTLLKKNLIEAKVSQASYYLYYAYIPFQLVVSNLTLTFFYFHVSNSLSKPNISVTHEHFGKV